MYIWVLIYAMEACLFIVGILIHHSAILNDIDRIPHQERYKVAMNISQSLRGSNLSLVIGLNKEGLLLY